MSIDNVQWRIASAKNIKTGVNSKFINYAPMLEILQKKGNFEKKRSAEQDNNYKSANK